MCSFPSAVCVSSESEPWVWVLAEEWARLLERGHAVVGEGPRDACAGGACPVGCITSPKSGLGPCFLLAHQSFFVCRMASTTSCSWQGQG